MQVCIASLMNGHELFTPLYIGSYPVQYTKGSYENHIVSMREREDLFYDNSQQEATAADEAYIKANVERVHNDILHIGNSDWVTFLWDIPHMVDLCVEKAECFQRDLVLNDAQVVTKVFTHGKEHQEIVDFVNNQIICFQKMYTFLLLSFNQIQYIQHLSILVFVCVFSFLEVRMLAILLNLALAILILLFPDLAFLCDFHTQIDVFVDLKK